MRRQLYVSRRLNMWPHGVETVGDQGALSNFVKRSTLVSHSR